MIFMAMRQNSLFRPFAIAEKPIMSYSCQEPFAAKDFALFDRLYVPQWSGNMALIAAKYGHMPS
jgi:hypothetical protein